MLTLLPNNDNAHPTAQQQSPDSTQRHDNQMFNGEGLGYVLEDVSPPSTSPNH